MKSNYVVLLRFDEYLSFATTNNSPAILLINEGYLKRLQRFEVTNKVTWGYVTVTLEKAEVTGISTPLSLFFTA